MKINHEKLGELEIRYNEGLEINFDNQWVSFYITTIGCQHVAKFRKHSVSGIKLTSEQAKEIDLFEKNEDAKIELESFRNKTSFTFSTCDTMFIPVKKYSHEILRNAEVVLIKNFPSVDKEVNTTAGLITETTVSIKGSELLKILDSLENEMLSKKSEFKIEKDKIEKVRIELAKQKAQKENIKVEISRYTDDCNDESEACDIDTIVTYVLPDGAFEVVRHHNW